MDMRRCFFLQYPRISLEDFQFNPNISIDFT